MSSDRTTTTAAVLTDEPKSDRAFLVVYLPDGDSTRTRVLPLADGADVIIGRMEGLSLVLDFEPVSRRHAKIVRHGTEILVEDLGSRNGTFVNGTKIAEPVYLAAGDEIAVGPMTAIVGVNAGNSQLTRIDSASDLEDRLAGELDRANRYRRPLGILMIRLDGDDEYIDEALYRISQTLRRMDMLAQYGPNEFAVLIPEADFAATEVAGKRMVEEALQFGRMRDDLTVHIGVAACPADGVEPGQLLSCARAALRAARAQKSGSVASAPRDRGSASTGTIVHDRLMKRVYSLAQKVAATPITVLILGETGVGKEVVANAIHNFSDRAGKPFIALNCSALPENLLESELFGHERGSFTGADRRKEGYFEAANEGTLFLDEVGEMPMAVQAKLLRVLEQRTITRVGGTQALPVNVRVVCATNRDPDEEIKKGRFREDLFFRLSAFTIVIPPLRNRASEIMPLCSHFAREFSRDLGQSPPQFAPTATALLENYDWPGNVRELRNAVERAMVLCQDREVLPEHLPERIVRQEAEAAPRTGGVKKRVADVEQAAVVEALEVEGHNQTKAAKRLGISRFALIRLMNKYGIKRRPRSRA